MKVTLTDVAQRLGISASTVSRALSAPERVNPATRDEVLRVVAEMGYISHSTVRPIPHSVSGNIGLIVPDIANPFFPPIIKAVQARANSHGKAVLIADTNEHTADELRRAKQMTSQVAGLIVVSSRTPDDRMQELIQLEPIVLVNRSYGEVPSVSIENSAGIREAVEHLVALGHRTISYLNGPRRSWSNEQRQRAVREACEDAGIRLIEFGPFEPQIQAGVKAADLVSASEATAGIAFDDMIALGVMTRLNERGTQIGSQLSVIGIDDSPMSGMAYPTLTSIHVPGAEAGVDAVDLLLEILESPGTTPIPNPHTKLETRLIVRSSTAPPPH